MYESLEHHLAVAEAAQRLRLPLLSQDGDVHEEEIDKLSTLSRSSFDSTMTSAAPSSSSISTSYNNYSSTASAATVAAAPGTGGSEPVEPGVGGVPDRFLGITSDYLYQVQQEQPAMTVVCIIFCNQIYRVNQLLVGSSFILVLDILSYVSWGIRQLLLHCFLSLFTIY